MPPPRLCAFVLVMVDCNRVKYHLHTYMYKEAEAEVEKGRQSGGLIDNEVPVQQGLTQRKDAI